MNPVLVALIVCAALGVIAAVSALVLAFCFHDGAGRVWLRKRAHRRKLAREAAARLQQIQEFSDAMNRLQLAFGDAFRETMLPVVNAVADLGEALAAGAREANQPRDPRMSPDGQHRVGVTRG